MNEELGRKEFEEWYWNELGQFDDGGYLDCFAVEEGDYYRLGTRMCWAAWQARAKQEIELPPVCDVHSDDTDKGYDICHYRVQEKLKQQGITFKIEGADRWKK